MHKLIKLRYNIPTSFMDTKMTILTLFEHPHPKLRVIANPVNKVDTHKVLITDMFETMYDQEGVGLAATQVGVAKRIFVMDVSPDQSAPFVFINPEITPLTDATSDIKEGCLSIPGIQECLNRPKIVKICALDKNGTPFEIIFEDLHAICVQHENDHLNGKLFVDYLSPLKQNRIKKKLEKQQRLNKD